MSCHTWAYKKVSSLTETEKKEITDRAIKEATSWWGFKYSKEELIARVEEWYEKQPQVFNVKRCGSPTKYAMNLLQEYTNKRDQCINRGLDYWLEEHKNDYPNCFEYNGEQYVNIGFDTPFRCCLEISNGFITTKKDLLDILRKQESYVIGYYDLDSNIFISGYTDELIERIEEYYSIHGENNIIFDFG